MPLDNFHEKYFSPPMEERQFIYPKPRADLFLNLVENYKIFCPKLTILYAGLNFSAELGIDYCIVFRGVNKEGRKFVLWDCPYLYCNRTIPSYRYAVKNSLHKEFFDECVFHLSQIPQGNFLEFVESNICDLSLDPKDPKFWKRNENAPVFMKAMRDLAAEYKPQGYRNPNRPKRYDDLLSANFFAQQQNQNNA